MWTSLLRLCLRPERESSLLWAICLFLAEICLRAILYLIKYQSNLCHCILVSLLSSYAEMLIDNQRSNKSLPESTSLGGPCLILWPMKPWLGVGYVFSLCSPRTSRFSFLLLCSVQLNEIWLWLIILLLISDIVSSMWVHLAFNWFSTQGKKLVRKWLHHNIRFWLKNKTKQNCRAWWHCTRPKVCFVSKWWWAQAPVSPSSS